ncbi:DUF2854 domain-containing protein [Leptolyngbya cf. ectocarpi LEGE 11479]|uniref:DUF2854 domain-containing protein n=1 Tax=Leptolyngbya cf. ectocarpi LEGE 11479 TaxID=1828722 RepID=A0A928X420_LEPEC|nr:DUF2854 domain-containing protein [Leptolyngbya ectocarpi]MBE9066708.1 DUF2854 domain-containing protein [Leptolyngbya cf. ectocarpi LEGE 11479]
MLRKIPLGGVLLSVGSILTLVGFVAYFRDMATLNLAGFFYGIPILLGGAALRAAELEPVPYSQEPGDTVVALRDKTATQTQNQVRKDVTRYRYGQDAHLDIALERLGLSPNDKQRPVLSSLQEEIRDGAYALVLEFDSPYMPLETWEEKHDKIEKFFGPNVRAEIDVIPNNRVALALIENSGADAA